MHRQQQLDSLPIQLLRAYFENLLVSSIVICQVRASIFHARSIITFMKELAALVFIFGRCFTLQYSQTEIIIALDKSADHVINAALPYMVINKNTKYHLYPPLGYKSSNFCYLFRGDSSYQKSHESKARIW